MWSIISQTNNCKGSCFFSRYSKFYVDCENGEENGENIFWLGDNCIWIGCVNHSLLLRVNTCIGCQYDNKKSEGFRYYLSRVSWANFLSDWRKNIREILACRFMQFFRPFNMLTVHKYSHTGIFWHVSIQLFAVYNFRKK